MSKEYRHLRVLREQLEEHADGEAQASVLSGMDYVKKYRISPPM